MLFVFVDWPCYAGQSGTLTKDKKTKPKTEKDEEQEYSYFAPGAVPKGNSQEELKAQWAHAKETAVVLQEFGSIKKTDNVRIIYSSKLAYTVVVRTADDSYKRMVIGADIFLDNCEIKDAQGNTAVDVAPAASMEGSKPEDNALQLETRAPVHTLPAEKPGAMRLSLMPPFLTGAGLLMIGIISTILLAKIEKRKRKR